MNLLVKQFYNTPEWKKIRLIALERDNYLCQKCLEIGDITPANVVHHIIPIDENNLDLLGLDLNNLISWCRNCHERHHGRLSEQEEDYYFDVDGQLISK